MVKESACSGGANTRLTTLCTDAVDQRVPERDVLHAGFRTLLPRSGLLVEEGGELREVGRGVGRDGSLEALQRRGAFKVRCVHWSLRCGRTKARGPGGFLLEASRGLLQGLTRIEPPGLATCGAPQRIASRSSEPAIKMSEDRHEGLDAAINVLLVAIRAGNDLSDGLKKYHVHILAEAGGILDGAPPTANSVVFGRGVGARQVEASDLLIDSLSAADGADKFVSRRKELQKAARERKTPGPAIVP